MLRKRIISAIILTLLLVGMFFLNKIMFYLALAAVAGLGVAEIWSANIGKHKTKIGFFLFLIFPSIYVVLSLVWIVGKLRWEGNVFWLILALVGTSAYDTFAYFLGKSIGGKHKIAPKISPNKTLEGTICGFLGPILVAAITGIYFMPMSLLQIAMLGLIIGFLAFFGDLSESWYKRRLGIKDMGNIIPGHGGLLDRIDSHLLVFVGVFCFRALAS